MYLRGGFVHVEACIHVGLAPTKSIEIRLTLGPNPITLTPTAWEISRNEDLIRVSVANQPLCALEISRNDDFIGS